MKNLGRLLLSTMLFSAWFAQPSLCEETFRPELAPRIELNGKLGNKRNISVIEAWIPLKQDSYNGQVLYSDLRFMQDDIDNEEGNFGVGYRELVPKIDAITGAYAYFDRRKTSYGNTFHQMTLGGEIMREDHDLRMNAYIPLSGKKRWQIEAPGQSGPYLADTGIYYDELGANQIEEPLTGFDLELGQRLPIFEDQLDSFRIFGAVYGFYGDQSEDVEGIRGRFQADINENLSVGARIQKDDVRGTQSFAELTLRFPAKKSFRKHGLYSRLDEAPERDVDIVSNAHIEELGQKNIAVTNIESGQAQKVYYVDNSNTSAGDGSITNPFRELANAEALASDHDIIYIGRGDGTSNYQDHGVTLAYEGMRLIGSGVDFSFDGTRFNAGGNSFDGVLLKAASGNSVISNMAGNGLTISGDNVEVQGLSVQNASADGILVTGDNVSLSGLTLSGNGGNGLRALNVDNLRVSNIDFDNNTAAGLSLQADNGSVTGAFIHGNSFTGNYNSLRVSSINGGSIDDVEISGNQLSDFTEKSIYVSADGIGSVISDTLINDNELKITGAVLANHAGVFTLASNSAAVEDITISENLFENVRCSVCVQASSGGDYTGIVSIEDNEIDGADNVGIYVGNSDAGSSINSLSIDRNEVSDSVNGIYISSASTASLAALALNENLVTGSTYGGISIAANNATYTSVSLLDNITNNNGTGLSVDSQAAGLISNLNITNHWSEDNSSTGIMILAAVGGRIGPVTILDSMVKDTGLGTYGALTIIATNSSSTIGNVRVQGTTVTGSQGDGVYVREGTGANFTGLVDFGGAGLSTGQNSFFGNRLANSSTYKDFRSWGGTLTVRAQQNWWGQATGPAAGQTLATSSTLTTTGYRTSAP